MSHKPHVYKDILFVSKGGGNNDSAKKGQLDRPWADPWEAVIAASAGDVVHVLDGIWTLGEVGDGADREATTNKDQSTLLKNQVSLFFNPGTGVNNIATVRNVAYIFGREPLSGAETWRIFGYGEFTSAAAPIFQIDESPTHTVDMFFECNTLDQTDYILALLRCYGDDSTFNFKVNTITHTCVTASSNMNAFYWAAADPATQTQVDGRFNLVVGDYLVDTVGLNATDNCALFHYRSQDGLNADVKCGTYQGERAGNGVLLFAGGWQVRNRNCNVHMNFGVVDLLNPGIVDATFANYTLDDTTLLSNGNGTNANEIPNLIYVYHDGPATPGPSFDNQNTVKVGVLRGHIPAAVNNNAKDANGHTCTNVNVDLEVDSAIMDANTPVVALTTATTTGGMNDINIEVKRGSCDSAYSAMIIDAIDSLNTCRISGKLINDNTGAVGVTLDNDAAVATDSLSLENLEVIMAQAADQVLENRHTSNNKNVNIQNVKTNSTATPHGDITEVGDQIIRASGLGFVDWSVDQGGSPLIDANNLPSIDTSLYSGDGTIPAATTRTVSFGDASTQLIFDNTSAASVQFTGDIEVGANQIILSETGQHIQGSASGTSLVVPIGDFLRVQIGATTVFQAASSLGGVSTGTTNGKPIMATATPSTTVPTFSWLSNTGTGLGHSASANDHQFTLLAASTIIATVGEENFSIGDATANDGTVFGGTTQLQGGLRFPDVTQVPQGTLSAGGALVWVENTELHVLTDDGVDHNLMEPSTYSIQKEVFDGGTAVTTGDGTEALSIPPHLNGYDLIDATATVEDKGVTGTTDVVVRRWRAGVAADMLSAAITIGDEWFANDGTIDTSNDDVQTGDRIYIDVDAIHSGTAPNGLSVVLTFQRV